MNDNRCSATTYIGWGSGFTRCAYKGKVERDGKWYCGTHDPVRRKAKSDANMAKWHAERDAKEAARFARETKEAALYQLAEAAVALGAELPWVSRDNIGSCVCCGDIVPTHRHGCPVPPFRVAVKAWQALNEVLQ